MKNCHFFYLQSRLVSSRIWAIGKFLSQPTNCSHELCPQLLASLRNWEELRLRRTKLRKPWKVLLSYSIQTKAFARRLALVGLSHVWQLRATSFSADQQHDEVDLSETPCPHCVKSVRRWTVSLMGSEVLNISCVHTEHPSAAVQCVQRKPERFQFGGTLLAMASMKCVEQDIKWLICNSS